LAAEIARASGGNPYFITELVQEVQSGPGSVAGVAAGGEITLEGLIRARLGRLPEGARRLLEVVAVSGRPLAEAEACRAATVGGDARALMARLEAARFIRGIGSAAEISLETYHDRIRETIVAGLPPESLREHQGRLAQVLEESGRCDPEEVAGHFEGAGAAAKAGEYYARAAERAAQALAFDRAATLYRRSLELRPVEGAAGRGLRAKLAEALANAGRGAEAGPIYLALAEETQAVEKLELWRRASDQLLISGRTSEGLDVLRKLLNTVGLAIPKGRRRTLLALVLETIRLRWRGLHFHERASDAIPPEELLRVDACDTAARRLCFIDSFQTTLFLIRYLRLALQSGEPSRIGIGLAIHGAIAGWSGYSGRARAEEILQRAKTLAERLGQPLVRAYTTFMEGGIAWDLGRWKESVARCEQAEEIAAKGQVSFAGERTKLRHIILDGLAMLGRWREMGRWLPAWREDARRRGDCFAGGLMCVHSYLPSLAADRPDDAEEFIRLALEEWCPGGGWVLTYWALYGRVEAALYRGEGQAGWELITRQWSGVTRTNGANFVQFLLLLLIHLRARAALAVAATAPAGGWFFGARARRLRAAARDARRIERQDAPWAQPLARLIRAGIAFLGGQRDQTLELLGRAEGEFTTADMSLYAAAACRRRGQLLGGEEGRALVAKADAAMTEQDIRNPARITAMLAPGFAD
jgi:hypothetical protein